MPRFKWVRDDHGKLSKNLEQNQWYLRHHSLRIFILIIVSMFSLPDICCGTGALGLCLAQVG